MCYFVNFFYNSFDGIFTSNFGSFISSSDMTAYNIKILKLLSDECIDFIEKCIAYFDIFSENFIFSIEAYIRSTVVSKYIFIVWQDIIPPILFIRLIVILLLALDRYSFKIIFPPIFAFSCFEIISSIEYNFGTIPSFFTII